MHNRELLSRIFQIVDHVHAIRESDPELVADVEKLIGGLLRARLNAAASPEPAPEAPPA